MIKKIFTFSIISIIFIILMFYSVYADEWGLRTIKGLESQCVNVDYDTYSCDIDIEDLKKFRKFEVYNTFEISGRLATYRTQINYLKIPNNTNICINSFTYLEEPYIFDLKIFRNNELIAEEPYIKFIYTNVTFNNKTKKIADFPCYITNPKDKIILEYSYGGKINPEKFLDLNFLLDERWYPFDKYRFESWNSLGQLYFTRLDKVILPSSYEVDKNKTILSCPFAIKGTAGKSKFAIFSDMVSYGGSFVYTDEKIVSIFPNIIAPPIEFIYDFLLLKYNLTPEEFENTYDKRTGCNLIFVYERPPIIKYIFFVAVMSMLLLSIYYLLVFKGKIWQKISRLLGYSFIVWSFQEGLNSLTPLVRPTEVTFFDLTILLPIILSIIYYVKNKKN